MKYVLALDQGTTSSRAIIFDRDGNIAALAQREFRQLFPQPGWAGHDALEIWHTQREVAQAAIGQLGAHGGTSADIAAIGITNQRETTVLWERASGRPLAPAIVWHDRRTAARCEALRAQGHEALVQQKTGLVLDPYFSATKLEWLLDHVPDARVRAERGELAFGTIDSWLLWNLTGGRVHGTDASNASRTMLFNLHTRTWDDELLALLRIPRALLPDIVPTCGVVAETTLFGAPLPIAGIAGDQQAATVGQACFAPGMAKNTYGTGCFLLMNTGAQPVASHNRLLTTFGWHGLPGPDGAAGEAVWCLEGSVFTAGAAVQWLRDNLGMIASADEIEPLAAQVDDTGDVFLVPAFAGLGSPDWDSRARGTLVGMTRATNRAHIARATLEAIALQCADVFAAMSADAPVALRELRVDGGAARNDLLMQMQADLLGVPVVRPQVTESTARGAASLAGLATGFWHDIDELAAQWRIDRRFEPQLPEAQRRTKVARWREAVERARDWARA